jgi:putative ABC transport system permease protein
METLWQDVRYAWRGLRRSPGFAAAALLSLVLGIGSSLAIFTVTDNLLLRPLPYRDPARLMMVWESHKVRATGRYNVINPSNYKDWKSRSSSFESMAIFSSGRAVLNEGGRSEELGIQFFSAEMLPMLGAQPLRGRIFTAEDDRRGAENVILLSHRIWQTWFAADEGVIGRKVLINSAPATVIGIMPPGFHFRDRQIDIWNTVNIDPARDYRATSGRYMMAAARLKPAVAQSQAQAEMTGIAAQLEAENPRFDANWTVIVEPLRDSLVRDVKSSLWILLGAVGLLLAVACANVANLLLARYTSRAREMAVRMSLGAGRGRVIRQLLTESVLLGLTGALLGVITARWTVKGLLSLAPRDLVRNVEASVDLRILLFAVVLAIFTGILFGLAPAILSARSSLIAGLRAAGRSITGGSRVRAWMVGAEVALSVILLIGATLLFRSLIGLQHASPGLDPANLLTFRVQIPSARYPEAASRTRFFARAIEQIESLPGVTAVSAVNFLPFTPLISRTYVNIAGRPPAQPGAELVTSVRTVMPGYFRAMRIPLRSGRDFTPADFEPAAPNRFLVNEAFVRQFLGAGQPLPQISVLMANENPFSEIIGVVADVKEGAVDKEPVPTAYYVHSKLISNSMVFVVRSGGDPLRLAQPVGQVIRSLDASQPVADIRAMEEVVSETFSRQRFSALLLSGFSLTALLLAAIGIYGVLAYSVTERTREIGVRVALGAEPARIVGLVVGSGARLVIGGAAAGLAGAFALTSLLQGLLFGVGPRDILTFVLVPVALALVALAAAYIPARRAARLQPMDALRAE